MLVEAPGIVLGKDRNLLDMGIGHIAERKINAPVAAGDRHCTHGSFLGKLFHSETISTC